MGAARGGKDEGGRSETLSLQRGQPGEQGVVGAAEEGLAGQFWGALLVWGWSPRADSGTGS